MICMKCFPGHECPAADKDKLPVRCPLGEVAAEGNVACTTCGAGEVATSASQCGSCDPGWTTWGGEKMRCVISPPNFAVDSADAEPIRCTADKQAYYGSVACALCPKGQNCIYSHRDLAEICPPGQYNDGTQLRCQPCPAA